ncbi:hypothetical protein TWF281_004357 [Arthrobotrys megalospora]
MTEAAGLVLGVAGLGTACVAAVTSLQKFMSAFGGAKKEIIDLINGLLLRFEEHGMYLKWSEKLEITVTAHQALAHQIADTTTKIKALQEGLGRGKSSLEKRPKLGSAKYSFQKSSLEEKITEIDKSLEVFHRFFETYFLFQPEDMQAKHLKSQEKKLKKRNDRLREDGKLDEDASERAEDSLRQLRKLYESLKKDRDLKDGETSYKGKISEGDIKGLERSNGLLTFIEKRGIIIKKKLNARKAERVNEIIFALSYVNEHTPGVLKFAGEANYRRGEYEGYVFAYPEGSEKPKTLRTILCDSEAPKHPLNNRLEVARHLAKAVWFLQTQRHVHKFIRPEHIVLFEQKGAKFEASKFPHKLGLPYLLGISSGRLEEDESARDGDEDEVHNMYRSDGVQGAHYERDCTKRDDIYSLGVVLLELGLWRSLCVIADDGTDRPDKEFCGEASDRSRYPKAFREAAARELPRVMGKAYASVVDTCLSIVRDVDFKRLEEEEGDQNAAMDFCQLFMERVLIPLEKISI